MDDTSENKRNETVENRNISITDLEVKRKILLVRLKINR